MAETRCIDSNVLLTVQATNNETVPVPASLFARTLQKFASFDYVTRALGGRSP
jgi:hypothetical protein